MDFPFPAFGCSIRVDDLTGVVTHWIPSRGTQAGAVVPIGWVLRGLGTPEGAVTAPVGTLFLRTDGGATTTLYVKTSGTGNTGWTAK